MASCGVSILFEIQLNITRRALLTSLLGCDFDLGCYLGEMINLFKMFNVLNDVWKLFLVAGLGVLQLTYRISTPWSLWMMRNGTPPFEGHSSSDHIQAPSVGECSSSTSLSSQQDVDVDDDGMIAVVLSEEYAKLDGSVGRRLTNLEPVRVWWIDDSEVKASDWPSRLFEVLNTASYIILFSLKISAHPKD